ATLYPQVGAGLSGSRRRQNFIGFDFFGSSTDQDSGSGSTSPGSARGSSILSSTSTRLGVSLDVSWEIDLWGKARAARRGALASVEAAAADNEAAHLSIAGQTAKAWFALIESKQQLELANAALRSYRTTTEQVRARYEHGLRPSLDLRLALSELASAQALVERRRERLDGTLRQLEILVGRYPAGQLSSPSTLPEPPSVPPAGVPSQLLSRRPDLVAAERRLNASVELSAEARASLYPSLGLTGSSGTSSEQLRDLLDGDFSVWAIGASLIQPVFQGGRLRAAVELADAPEAEAMQAYANSVLNAYAEVESLLAVDGFLAARERQLATASRESDAARRLAEERYLAGLEDYVTVLSAQRNALAAESSYLDARRARLDARVDLYLALGGGFRAELAPGTVSSPDEETADYRRLETGDNRS
ncbi:MAG: efflux transporter outer membrane subunit, partial [Candidatus Binatia bacterium]